MNKPATLEIVTVVLTSLFTYPCWAGHIPGHKDSDPVFPVPEPSTLGLLTLGIVGLVRRRCAWQRSQKKHGRRMAKHT